MFSLKIVRRIANNLKIKNRNMILMIIIILLCSYFSYYTIYGKSGILHYFEIKEEIEKKKAIKNKLRKKLDSQKDMIGSIKTDNLDLDLLDEQTRKKLGYAKDDEIIIYEE